MKVLLVNNHHSLIGGAEKYYFDLGKLLTKNGHSVAYFSTKDKNNLKTKWSKYFIKKLDFKTKSLSNSLEKFPKIFYNTEAKRNMAELLDQFKPDIVHLQNIYYYITPSIIPEIKKRGIPIVQTVHDYQLISPSVIMYHDGTICEVCKNDKYYKAIFHKCVKNSYMATFMAVVTLYFQNFNNWYQKSIDMFISPSLFMKNKLVEYGVPAKKIVHINNFLPEIKNVSVKKGKEKYILYFGRICEAKGIFTLLGAAEKLPKVHFKIAGSFEDNEIKKKVLEKVKNSKMRNVDFVGFKKGAALQKLISQSEFVVVPSEWYENQPYAVSETLAQGKKVIASEIGGIPEMAGKGLQTYFFKPGSEEGLVNKIKILLKHRSAVSVPLQKTVKKIPSEFDPQKHYLNLVKIYNGLTK